MSHLSSWWFFSTTAYKEKKDKYSIAPWVFFSFFPSFGDKIRKYSASVLILLNAHSNEIEELCRWH